MAVASFTDLPDIDDPAVPWRALLGAEATDLLAAAVGGGGGSLRGVVPRQATYHPGRSLTVRYDATVAWADGRSTTESFVAVGGDVPTGAVVLHDGEQTVGVWRVPHDPLLPGLAPALDPLRTREMLGDLGAPVPEATPRLRAYRPGRRAVVELTAPGVRLYLKIVRRGAAEALHRRHSILAEHVPVPRSLGWSDEHALVVLQALPGVTMRQALESKRTLPGGAALLALLDQLPNAPRDARPGWQAVRFARTVGAVAPELHDRVDTLAATLTMAEDQLHEPTVPVHGDFHEAQLLVDGGRISGLLDVDTFGTGRRLDDLATMVGHLSTLAATSRRRVPIERHAARVLDTFDRAVDPVALRHAVAAVVLGLATGPFRVLESQWRRATAQRVLLAEHWLASAGRVSAGLVR